ncbi:hypothetical protein C0991_010939 [Blastosporella zonata]|nr:hypothetical protein C0991_010939 [Blastosporella zonata]
MPVSEVGAIQSVLKTYPPSKGLFREILQNSEDAKATKQIFVLDNRTSSKSLVEHEHQRVVQSDALLAYNNSSFNEGDFKSLLNLWDSSKKADTSKIGKFGMGFRSTFHLTDTPQVLSDSSLVILDPQQTDQRIDIDDVENLEPFALDIFEDILNAVSSLGDSRRQVKRQKTGGQSKPFRGTVIRLPLRAAPSKISREVFSPADIRHLLMDFIKDEIRITLLFLTHVTSIEIYEINLDHQITCLAKSAITRSAPNVFKHMPTDMQTATFVDLTERSEVDGHFSAPEDWRILHTSFAPQLAASELSRRLGFDAAGALEQQKLQPVMAIAIRLPIADVRAGRLFTYLPLPLVTQFCVHVHGLFALTPSREKLQNREETPVPRSDYHISIEWNKLLFDEYLPQSWMCLLSVLAASEEIKDIFAAWPPSQKSNQLGDSGYWEKLPDNLLARIIENNCSVWPVFGLSGVFSVLDDVLVAGAGESDRLLSTLAAMNVKLTKPSNVAVDLLKKSGSAKFMTPETVYGSLVKLAGSFTSDEFANGMPIVLKYLLSTSDLKYIIGLPLITITGNRRITFTDRNSATVTHVLMEPTEYRLFEACDKDAIALRSIDPYVAGLLKRHGTNILNVQLLSPEVILGYLRHNPGLAPTASVDAMVSWLSDFWLWIRDWHSGRQLYASLGSLLMIPTQVGLQRTDSPIFDSNGLHPVQLLPLKKLRVPFLHQALNVSARSALRNFQSFGDVRNLTHVLDALDLKVVKSFKADEETARQLVSYLSSCAPQALSTDQRKKLRALPIYPSHSRTGHGRVRLPDEFAVFGAALNDLQIVPELANTVILDGPQWGVNLSLLQAVDPDTRGFLSDIDILRLALIGFTTQLATTQQGIVEFMASNKGKVPGELFEMLGKTSFVIAADGLERCPFELIDPESPLSILFETGSRFSPRTANCNEQELVDNLHVLRLFQSSLSDHIISERIRHITCMNDQECARKLIRVIYETKFHLPQISEIYERWMPTPRGLLSPRDCRDDPHHRKLFDLVLSPLDHELKTDVSFRAVFAWDQPISVAVLVQQLSLTLASSQDDAYHVVSLLVKELMCRDLSDNEIQCLRDKVIGRSWVPVVGTDHRLVMPEYAVFFGEDKSAGFYQIRDSGPRSIKFYTRMGCTER